MTEKNPRSTPSRARDGVLDDTEVPSSPLSEEEGGVAEYAPAASSRKLEVVIALVALGASVLLVYLAGDIEIRRESQAVGPRSWPRVLGVGGIVVSVALLLWVLLRGPFSRDDLESLTRQGLARSIIAGALSVGLVVAWPLVSFEISAMVFLVAVTFLFGGRGWRTLILFPVLTTAFIYLLFHVALKVPL